MFSTLALGMPGPLELIIIAAIGLLLFGKRLPEVGKGLARGIVEFKNGLKDVTKDVEIEDDKKTKAS
jgi:sec-independent protein translocase protein TatA